MTIEILEEEMKTSYREWETIAQINPTVSRMDLIDLMTKIARRFAASQVERIVPSRRGKDTPDGGFVLEMSEFVEVQQSKIIKELTEGL